jgi:hypothetical protein
LKQLFAGQMGITILAIPAGLAVGAPLDSSSSSWDASTSQGYKHVCHDLLCEDPYLPVSTQPCYPWGNWSRSNIAKGGQAALTVLELRDQGRPILKLVAKVIVGRVKAKQHVFVEQPAGSSWLEEEELVEVVKLIEEGSLITTGVDGCQVGYCDRENGLPHHKPSTYLTTMLTAEALFSGMTCGRDHQHQYLEGNNCFGSRASQAFV